MERGIKLPTESESAAIDIVEQQQLRPQQLSTQHSLQTEMDIGKLWHAATRGRWKDVDNYRVKHPNALTWIIMEPNMTLLHVAARAGNSDFVIELLKLLQPEDIDKTDGKGNNALHYIAKVGKVEAAMEIVIRKEELLVSLDDKGNTPLMLATEWGVDSRKDMVRFLAISTVNFYKRLKQPFTGFTAIEVTLRITAAGFHDICLAILYKNPDLVLEVTDTDVVPEDTILMVMAKYPKLFTKERTGLIYDHCFSTRPKRMMNSVISHDVNLRFTDSMALVDFICQKVSKLIDTNKVVKDQYLDGLAPAIHLATKNGILEMVRTWLSYFPDTLWQKHDNRLLFHVAVEHRQLEIFRHLIDLAGEFKYSIFQVNTQLGNILHLAAIEAPYAQLHSVSGSALQLQREFQWFKMVEEIVPNACNLAKGKDGKTPRELFTKEHESLHNEAKDWMRTTSENCMVVTTLVAGVVFSSMIQVPGGLDNDGNPNYLGTVPFAVFTTASGLALFASMTSLLIFLAIQTSPYDEDDFADSLPRKLMGGLFTLFLAIAAMVVGFAAALQIAVHSKFRSIYIVSAVFGWIPIYFFGSFQVPLFREMVKSTFCGYTFHRNTQRNCWKRLLGFKDSSQSNI